MFTTPVAAAQKTATLTTPHNNIECKSTISPAPVKQSSPSTRKSTSLYRHFLRQVKMPPITPPRSPTRNKRDSPAKGRESPNKQHLEIGLNGFYFSCELPMSKVMPKKADTPSKVGTPEKHDTSTPTTKTMSPMKISSPAKGSFAKILSATPVKKLGTPAMYATGSGSKPKAKSDASAIRTVKFAPRLMGDSSITSPSTLRSPPEHIIDLSVREVTRTEITTPSSEPAISTMPQTKQAQSSLNSQPSNIGQLMAGLRNARIPEPRDFVGAASVSETDVSPAPTPLHRASDKLRLLPPKSFYTTADVRAKGISWGLLKDDADALHTPTVTSNLPIGDQMNENDSPCPRPIEAKKKFLSTSVTAIQTGGQHTKFTSQAAQLGIQPWSSNQIHIDIDGRVNERTIRHKSLLFIKPEQKGKHRDKALHPEKHVKWKESAPMSNKRATSQIPRIQKRVGTAPSVLLVVKKEMATVEAAMRTSTGQPFVFRGPANNNELPVMSSAIIKTDHSAEKADSKTTSIHDVQASFTTSVQSHNAAQETSSTTLSPALGEIVATEKQADICDKKTRNRSSVTTPRSRLMSSVATKSLGSTATAANKTPRAGDSIFCKRPPISPGRESGKTSIPRSVRKSVFDTTASTKTAANSPISARKTLYTTPQLKATKKPADSSILKPYNLITDPHLCEENFASAAHIAEKIAEWNIEDRQKAALAIAVAKAVAKTPLKEAKSIELKWKGRSFTPEGSPTKFASPIRYLKARSMQLDSALNSPVPKTPANGKVAATHMRDHGNLRIPMNSKAGKTAQNRRCTPPKAIESSLDKAIDAKIAEDARAGKEFTPGGNRVKDLLEAKQREIC